MAASSIITPDSAYQICLWVDKGASGDPPSPWKTVFLPVKSNPNFAVILQDSGNTSQYAVVIQGTKSIWDALLDFGIDAPVGFVPIQGAQIAQGANDGLNNVLALQDSDNRSLQQVLSSIDWSASYLFLTGHSLGGTLASLMAPWAATNLFGRPSPLSLLPPAIHAITFAAFAAGNQPFAGFLNSHNNYQAHFNANDVVPHVWATAGRYSVSNMYSLFPSPGPSPMPSDLQATIQKKVDKIPPGFSYVQTKGTSFMFPSESTSSWLTELSYQHNNAYNTRFGAGDARSA